MFKGRRCLIERLIIKDHLRIEKRLMKKFNALQLNLKKCFNLNETRFEWES